MTNETWTLRTDAVRLIAHRGSSAAYPEHTRAAYQQALDDGADGIETDVRLTADGVAVCWHDPTVDRTTEGHGELAGYTLDELARLDLLRGKDIPATHGDPARQLMTLAALLELARGAGRPLILAVELKASASPDVPLIDAVLSELEAAGWDPALGLLDAVQISLQCFDEATARLLLQCVPAHLVMLLTHPRGDDEPAAHALVDAGSAHVGPSIEWMRRRPERILDWLAQGTTVRAWTIDEPDDLRFCLGLGIAEITTNRPRELRAALAAPTTAAAPTSGAALQTA
ncbi:glycerophosphodiester phosphodiesterase family protein [Naasia sp. SYSU D00948]|uniref:glycerophosphodiester phosphodiesterase n=1 Tax=Naasia sp. SYSU D00948 TaxID=2817379 RepID=UPI001B30A179|nr:glycerophosphodiester phosphodiesterase family protein [Naasia sp. SYSU D00948]